MSTPTITESTLLQTMAKATAEAKQIEIADGKTTGLRFRASYGGAGAFYLMYRPRGQDMKRIRLNRLGADRSPKALKAALDEARRQAASLLGKVADGADPHSERKEAAEAARAAALAEQSRKTVPQMVEAFLHEKRDLRWIRRYEQMLTLNLLSVPALRDKFADELTGDDIDGILTAVIARQKARREAQRMKGKPVSDKAADTQAARVFEVLRAMIRFAAKKKWLSADIINTVSRPKDGDARKRVLSVDELRLVWNTLADWDRAWSAGISKRANDRPPIPHNAVRVLRLQMLTGCRTGELAGMMRKDLTEGLHLLTVPEERSKNGLPALVPLGPLAREIVAAALTDSADDKMVFPVHARDGSGSHPLRADVISTHVATIQGRFDFVDTDGKPAPFVAHDLRRSVATYVSKMGTLPEVVSAILNHAPKGVTREHYDLNEYLPEKRLALTRWQAKLLSIAEGEDPFKIDTDDIEALEARILREERGARSLTVVAGGKS